MSDKSGIKTLTIRSTNDTTNFNLSIDNVNYGVFKKHNALNTNTLDSKIDLSFHYLTKRTDITIRMIKNEDITVKWNKLKGRFELVDKADIIISEKTYLTRFSKIFYPVLALSIILISVIVLLVVL